MRLVVINYSTLVRGLNDRYLLLRYDDERAAPERVGSEHIFFTLKEVLSGGKAPPDR